MDIKIKDFEGPLDLLLHLVSKYQMNIYEVPLIEVIEQYLAYLATLQAMKLEVAGEYMLMASQLTLIKSRRLLPKVAEEMDEAEDLEQDLLSQLEEYRTYKQLGELMASQHEERALYYSKPKMELVYDDTELLHDRTTVDLFLAFSKLLTKKKEEFRQNHTTIVKDEYKIEDLMDQLRHRFHDRSQVLLQDLFLEAADLQEVITLFLATLELIKIQEVTVVQDRAFGEIYLNRIEHEQIS
ncbi:MAG: segregation/condensation protein A [Streptococcus sp.]|jgi:segregation and condensation protein A|uniref:segregation/condensation protein A n=1 Tax=Streptococcus sp. TaxID=1306 RepID=UPI001CABE2E9|nr:segregation/condensation protein A [Streptococcus sp.]MBF1738921.1 segregation/condensation protein A [Streptococcus sp.]